MAAGHVTGRDGRPRARERVSALVALVALAGALVVLAVGAVANWKGLVVTVVGLLVLVVGGWYAVSRRGPTRSVALLASIGGAGLFVGGFLVGEGLGAARFIGAAVLAGVSVVAGRAALGRPRGSGGRQRAPGTPVTPARHPALIINPRSGGGKAASFHLEDECRSRGIEPIVLRPGDDLLQLADDAISRGADVIGMAGGDGSQALVATVAIRHDVPHVVVPAGTRNHFALDLGLDRDDVVGALDAFGDGLERVVDLATVNGRIFVNNASLGSYAKIVQSPDYRGAKGRTAAEMLPDLIGPDATPLDLRFADADGVAHPTAQVLLVSNNAYELHSIEGMGTRERLDQGVLGVVALRVSTAGEATAFFGLEATGRPQRFRGWLEWTAPQFRIDSGGPVEVGLDGEALKLDPPLLFEIKPRALRIRVPRHAVGRSPAAAAMHMLSRSTITALARVVVGHAEAGVAK